MSNILDLYGKGTTTGAPNLAGLDKTPIATNDLTPAAIDKANLGVLGSGSPSGYGGYDDKKTYESLIGAK